jgi:hypothetical protein
LLYLLISVDDFFSLGEQYAVVKDPNETMEKIQQLLLFFLPLELVPLSLLEGPRENVRAYEGACEKATETHPFVIVVHQSILYS